MMEKNWLACKALLLRATRLVSCLKAVKLCKRHHFMTNLFLYKEKNKHRKSKKKYRRTQGGNDRRHYCKLMKEAWLLASSLKKGPQVIKYYKHRMQIEEGFRDLKSARYGFGFREAYSRSRKDKNIIINSFSRFTHCVDSGLCGGEGKVALSISSKFGKRKKSFILILFRMSGD